MREARFIIELLGVSVYSVFTVLQVKEVHAGKVKLLAVPNPLPCLKEFEHFLSREQALKLVTVVPLFPCLNDTTDFVMKQTNKRLKKKKKKT